MGRDWLAAHSEVILVQLAQPPQLTHDDHINRDSLLRESAGGVVLSSINGVCSPVTSWCDIDIIWRPPHSAIQGGQRESSPARTVPTRQAPELILLTADGLWQ